MLVTRYTGVPLSWCSRACMPSGLEHVALTESVRWVKMALGGHMSSFLERLPGAVAISALCLLFQTFPGMKPRQRIGSKRGLESGQAQGKSFLPRSLQASVFCIHRTKQFFLPDRSQENKRKIIGPNKHVLCLVNWPYPSKGNPKRKLMVSGLQVG